jgi:hypothetical protein
LSLKRWSAASIVQSRRGSFVRAQIASLSAGVTNSSCVERKSASGTGETRATISRALNSGSFGVFFVT